MKPWSIPSNILRTLFLMLLLLSVLSVSSIAQDKPIHTLERHREYVNTLSYSPDDTKLASGSDDNTIRLWDVAPYHTHTHKT